jgi:large subunit ribosomal protein L22e
VREGVLNINNFADYLKGRIKILGKTNQLEDKVSVGATETKLQVVTTIPFSKRYLKYLTKKYLKKNELREYLYVSATSKKAYELRFYKIEQPDE